MKQSISPATAQAVIDRDRDQCVWCGAASHALHLAHVRSRGARRDLIDHPLNICQLCGTCHMDRQHQQGTITTALLIERLVNLYGDDFGAL